MHSVFTHERSTTNSWILQNGATYPAVPAHLWKATSSIAVNESQHSWNAHQSYYDRLQHLQSVAYVVNKGIAPRFERKLEGGASNIYAQPLPI
jgi:hypothetical protein